MFGLMMKWMKANKILPQISDTERQALEAGHVWIDGEFFGGNPDFKKMLAQPYSKLPPEEQAFLDGPVEELLNLIDRYEIQRTKRMPEEILGFVKRKGFMGFLIPKEYGGLDFTTLGISTIMAKIGPVNATVGTFVVIPNSIGAAELIIHYGTQAQKDQYLPKLARGEYVPCFGHRTHRRLRRREHQGRRHGVQGRGRRTQAQAQLPQTLHHPRADRQPGDPGLQAQRSGQPAGERRAHRHHLRADPPGHAGLRQRRSP